ncbi:MAG TPA: hypothetical protein VFL31_06955 [Nitrospiraceae bacterium]|nr:hypothetical protein [Nitrospiraceae bacterium]
MTGTFLTPTLARMLILDELLNLSPSQARRTLYALLSLSSPEFDGALH